MALLLIIIIGLILFLLFHGIPVLVRFNQRAGNLIGLE